MRVDASSQKRQLASPELFLLSLGRGFVSSVTPITREVFLVSRLHGRGVAPRRKRALVYEPPSVGIALDKSTFRTYTCANAALLTFCVSASRHCLASSAQKRYAVVETRIGRIFGCGLACIVVSVYWGAVYAFSAQSRQSLDESRERSTVSSAPFPASWPTTCTISHRGTYLFVVVPSTGRLPLTSREKRPPTIDAQGIRILAYPLFSFHPVPASLNAAS
jgi:hypothetical protein